ncbi:hypothetical protein BKA67DRAFT_694825 [Truncatella angustata]|uniref:Uncharacterized protein n=1 Tax=Truncatella angustata TaxID=152316 RepID=A0A9P8RP87_9PEZI|nr:uncharacterized protein BKA67DRAFT_694825 [Truncatella angustata]KAH6647835.1 hypothetical protein BKA67DRAFT_694825 [Truncatella angustata]
MCLTSPPSSATATPPKCCATAPPLNVTTKDNTVQSSDPSTQPDSTIGQKLKGEFHGAIHTATDSVQATAGALARTEKLKRRRAYRRYSRRTK